MGLVMNVMINIKREKYTLFNKRTHNYQVKIGFLCSSPSTNRSNQWHLTGNSCMSIRLYWLSSVKEKIGPRQTRLSHQSTCIKNGHYLIWTEYIWCIHVNRPEANRKKNYGCSWKLYDIIPDHQFLKITKKNYYQWMFGVVFVTLKHTPSKINEKNTRQ